MTYASSAGSLMTTDGYLNGSDPGSFWKDVPMHFRNDGRMVGQVEEVQRREGVVAGAGVDKR